MATGSLVDFSREQLLEQIRALQREPFQRELVKLIAAAPSEAEMREWSKKSIDRYAQSVMIFGKLAGYSERVEVQATGLLALAAEVGRLSDSEIERRLVEVRESRSLPALPPKGSVQAELVEQNSDTVSPQ